MYKHILFPVDMEHTGESTQALGIALAEAQRSGARLTIMTVAPGFGSPLVASYFDQETVKAALKEVARHLKQYIDDNVPEGIETHAVVVEGNPANLILKQAQDDDGRSRRQTLDLLAVPGLIEDHLEVLRDAPELLGADVEPVQSQTD